MKGDRWDPKGLISEAYRIEGISAAECRSIFLDWALSLPEGTDTQAALAVLIERVPERDHPMTGLLAEGRARLTKPGRRGGSRSRNRVV